MTLETKLKTLPHSPGVYFHKDKFGEIIYVGKAAVLKNRVKQYFQSTRDMDVKTKVLVSEIADTDWIKTESEIDALFLEAEMVKRYMPKFNILLRDDKSLTYVRIDMKNEWPFVSFTRNPADDGADYFGPYYNSFAVKKALRYLRKIFPYYTIKKPNTRSVLVGDDLTNLGGVRTGVEKLNLDDHLGLSPIGMTGAQYKANLRKLISYLNGNRVGLIKQLEAEMKKLANSQDFESAAAIRNKIQNLKELQRRIMFGDKEFLDISKDRALSDLSDILNFNKNPVRIEGFDISHMSGTNVVASMVVFKNGVSDRSQYRKFKTKIEQNDDYFNMAETVTRRLSKKNLKSWGTPNLVLIDGGKGQLDAAIKARNRCGLSKIPFIGLAKRDEQIVLLDILPNKDKIIELGGDIEITDGFILINIPKSAHLIKLLQRIRDESHRFAVSYHTVLRKAQQTAGALDEVRGIGPKTKAKLIKKFGSVSALKSVSESDIALVVGKDKAKRVVASL